MSFPRIRLPGLLAFIVPLLLCLVACGHTSRTSISKNVPRQPVIKPPVKPSLKPVTVRDEEGVKPSTERSLRLWSRAQKAESRGDVMQATRDLLQLELLAGRTPEGIQASLKLGSIAVENKAYLKAVGRLKRLKTVGNKIHERQRLVLLASAYEGLESFDRAVNIWKQVMPLSQSHAADIDEARKGAARTTFLAGNPRLAQVTLGNPSRDALRALVKPKLTPRLLESLYGKVDPLDPWRAWIALQIARTRCEQANLAGCRQAAQEALERTKNPLIQREAREVLSQVARWNRVKKYSVGVLLPLSGPYARIGQAALKAVRLSAANFPQLTLVVADTKGDAKVAQEKAQSLILNQSVSVLVGPVGKKETEAVATVAARFGVPLSHFSAVAPRRSERPTVFRTRMSPAEQGDVMARYGGQALKLKRYAIVYPDNTTGRRAMVGFWDAVLAQGGEIRGVQSYPPGTKDFGKVVSALLNAKKPGQGTVDFDALFIPGAAMTVRRLVPFLKYWGVMIKNTPTLQGRPGKPVVQLLGTSGWNHRAVIVRGEALTNNAIFVAPFFHDPTDPVADGFARAFFRANQRQPLAFHAEVYDGTQLLFNALAPESGHDHSLRGRVVSRIMATPSLRGVTGVMRVLSDGRITKQSWILTIDLDSFRVRLTEEEEVARKKEALDKTKDE